MQGFFTINKVMKKLNENGDVIYTPSNNYDGNRPSGFNQNYMNLSVVFASIKDLPNSNIQQRNSAEKDFKNTNEYQLGMSLKGKSKITKKIVYGKVCKVVKDDDNDVIGIQIRDKENKKHFLLMDSIIKTSGNKGVEGANASGMGAGLFNKGGINYQVANVMQY